MDSLRENVRRAAFAERPSRYQTTFCWQTLEDAVRFTQLLALNAPAVIWEIEGESRFRADKNLLQFGTALEASLAAHRYWRGDTLPRRAPHWEVFVDPGARVLRRAA